MNRTVTDEEKNKWNAKSTFSGSYKDLQDIPDFKTIATSGNYQDLQNLPTIPSKLSELETDAMNRTVTESERTEWNAKSTFSGNYEDLSNLPSLKTVATTGYYSDLINSPSIPTKLSDLNPDEKHQTVTDIQINNWDAKSIFSGNYSDLSSKPNIDEMIQGYIERAFTKTVPIGTIVMWRGERIPDCWTEVREMRGLFPVGVGKCTNCDNSDFFYELSETGGKAGVALSVEELAPHSHSIWTNTDTDAAGGSKGEKIKANTLGGTSGTTGQGKAHENRPPYYGIFFIEKTSDVCYKNK